METEHPGPDVNEPAEPAAGTGSPAEGESPAGPPDPAALVARLIEVGEWPDPVLLDQIVAAGEAALGPLFAFLRTYPSAKDYRREIVLYNGIGILSEIRSPAAIRDLIEILKRYPEESGEMAAEALGHHGAAGFEAALELLRDPNLSGRYRRNAIDAAKYAAGSDPTRRARLAEAIRPLLAAEMERMRLERRRAERESAGPQADEEQSRQEPAGPQADEEQSRQEGQASSDVTTEQTGVQAVYGPEPYPMDPSEELTFLVCDLADLADPESRDLVKTAFAEKLVNTWIADEESIEESYRQGGEDTRVRSHWLEVYRERYDDHIERLNRPPEHPRTPLRPSRLVEVRPDDAPAAPPPEPIRKTGPKLGRNDPCWCGSGKKYKKCHLGKDGRS
jgi:hypothetical protein